MTQVTRSLPSEEKSITTPAVLLSVSKLRSSNSDTQRQRRYQHKKSNAAAKGHESRRGEQGSQRRDLTTRALVELLCSHRLARVQLVRMEMVAPSALTSRKVFGVLDQHGLPKPGTNRHQLMHMVEVDGERENRLGELVG